MKIQIINQPPLDVSAEDAKKIISALKAGGDYIIVNGEYVRASAITGIRNDVSGEKLTVNLWGALPAGKMEKFYDDRREDFGPGYAKYQAMKAKLFGRA